MCAVEESPKSKHQLISPNQKNDKRMTEIEVKMLDGMLTIGQVSRITGVNKTTLRYWEKTFNKFLIPSRIKTSHRQYSWKDIEIINTIKKLKDEEYLSVKGINLRLKTLYLNHEDQA